MTTQAPRQSSQRRTKAASNAQLGKAPGQSAFASTYNTKGASAGTSAFAHSLTIQRNLLLNQQQAVQTLSPTAGLTTLPPQNVHASNVLGSNTTKASHSSNFSIQSGLLASTNSIVGPQTTQPSHTNVSARVKKFKQSRHGVEPSPHHPLGPSTYSNLSPNSRVLAQPPHTTGSKTRQKQLDSNRHQKAVSTAAQNLGTSQIGQLAGCDQGSVLLGSMPQMAKVKSNSNAGAGSSSAAHNGPSVQKTLSNNRSLLQAPSSSYATHRQNQKPETATMTGLASPSSVSNHGAAKSIAASPDTTMVQLSSTVPSRMLHKPTQEADKIMLMDNSQEIVAAQTDQIYLIGGNFDTQRASQLTPQQPRAARPPKTIFDYETGGAPQQSTVKNGQVEGGTRASSGNFVFQPVLKSTPDRQATNPAFKPSSQLHQGKANTLQSREKQRMGRPSQSSKEAKNLQSRVTSGRNSISTRRSNSRKPSQGASAGNYAGLDVPIRETQPANFYQPGAIQSRNTTQAHTNQHAQGSGAFVNSRESLKHSMTGSAGTTKVRANKQMTGLKKQSREGKRFAKTSQVPSSEQNRVTASNEDLIDLNNSAINNSAINNYMQTITMTQNNLKGIESLFASKQQLQPTSQTPTSKSLLGISARAHLPQQPKTTLSPSSRQGQGPEVSRRMQDELLAMVVQRNIQTAGTSGQAQRTALKSNLVSPLSHQSTEQTQQQSTLSRGKNAAKRPLQIKTSQSPLSQQHQHVGARTGPKRTAKDDSRSPSSVLMSQAQAKQLKGYKTVDQAKESSQVLASHTGFVDLNLTTVRAEEPSQVPRDPSTAAVQLNQAGVLTPELLHASANQRRGEVFYRSPQNLASPADEQKQLTSAQALLLLKDQEQAYFTSDSRERLAQTQAANSQTQARRSYGSFAQQASPRTSYYSPDRRQPGQSGMSKNVWLNETFPVASPQRTTLTPHQRAPLNNSALKQTPSSQKKKQLVGVTHLGTSYDFNKLKKGLETVQHRNNTTTTLSGAGTHTSGQAREDRSSNERFKEVSPLGKLQQVGTQEESPQVETCGNASSDIDNSPDDDQNQNQPSLKEEEDLSVTEKEEITQQTQQAKSALQDVARPSGQAQKQRVTKRVTTKDLQLSDKTPPPEKSAEAQEEEVIVFSEIKSMDDYIIGKQIGQGAYATVHMGVHKRYSKKVALKIYLKDKMKDLQRKKSVRREIKLMRRLEHPNIAKLYEAVETETKVILVMEFVGGGSTHGFLKSKPNRQMEEAEARRIFAQLVSALHYLHQKSIAHRDIKLENVMLDHKGNVKLIDFGFSTQIPNTQKIKLFCGTPSYMAPEIVKKIEFCGPPADIYASGVLLFAFFCGRFPYRGKDDKDLYKKIANEDLVLPEHVPSAPKKLIARMLQKDPESRPSAQDLFRESWVEAGLNAASSLASMAKQTTRSNSIKRRHEKSKPCSPCYLPGQKVMTPLSDHKDEREQAALGGLIYEGRATGQRTLLRPQHAAQRLANTADSAQRPNPFGNNQTRTNAETYKKMSLATKQQQPASARGYSQQRDQAQPNFDRVETIYAAVKHKTQMGSGGGTGQNTQGPGSQKPSTPVHIGRYYTAGQSSHFGTGGSATIQRGRGKLGGQADIKQADGGAGRKGGKQDLTRIIKPGSDEQRGINTVRQNRSDLVDQRAEATAAQQINSSRVEAHQRRLHPQLAAPPSGLQPQFKTISSPKTSMVAQAQSQNQQRTASSANSDRYPRKPTGPGATGANAGFFNSEAYNAYYTHSAAAGNSQAGSAPGSAPSVEPNNGTQDAPAGQEGGQKAQHQTINNNINIINYITQIACSHPSHGPRSTESQGPQQSQSKASVYSPTGKATPTIASRPTQKRQ